MNICYVAVICNVLLHVIDYVKEITLRWMPQNTFYDRSALAQVMAYLHQAKSHYLSQCWPRSMSTYGFTASQWLSYTQHNKPYRQICNITCTLVANKLVDHSFVVGALPAGVAPTTSSFWTKHLASMECAKTTARRDQKCLRFGIGAAYTRGFTGYRQSTSSQQRGNAQLT